jgi:hypothetical protein
MEIDVKKMPLGKMSKQHIQKGARAARLFGSILYAVCMLCAAPSRCRGVAHHRFFHVCVLRLPFVGSLGFLACSSHLIVC